MRVSRNKNAPLNVTEIINVLLALWETVAFPNVIPNKSFLGKVGRIMKRRKGLIQ